MADAGSVEERLLTDNIKMSLRNMFKSFDTYIKEAKDYDQLEENLKHMEETDENFHKYDLVATITDGIENLLGDSIDKHVNDMFNNIKFDGDIDNQNRTARAICDEIVNTKEFLEFKTTLNVNIDKANDYLQKNFQNAFNECQSEVTINENESKSIAFTNDCELSPDNSMNQHSFVFFNSEQFPNIAENLDPRKPEHVRLRAMQQLINIPANDPPAAEFWNKIRRYLINALKDPNEKIADLCLKLHSRTLASSHPTVSKEIYSCLAENLCDFFRDRELEKRLLKANIDVTSAENAYLLKQFRLLNDYAKEVTKYWIRYSETFVKSIIDDTLLLFDTVKNKFGYYMTPIHYMALLDIDANWFTKWMHGHDSRRCVIESMKTRESILHHAVSSILLYANSKRIDTVNYNHKKSNTSHGIKRTMFRKFEIEFCHFIHSLKIVTKLLCFKNGRKLFPVKATNKEITIKELMKFMIQIMLDTSISKINGYSPPKYICNLLLDLCSSEETCEACFCYDDVIDLLLKPLKTILQLKKNSVTPYNESCILYMANILSKLASTECGCRQLLFGESKNSFVINRSSAANSIMTFVRKALTNQLNCHLSNMEIGEYLYLARILYSQCQGAYLIKEYDLVKSISDAWKNQSTEKDKVINPSTPRQANASTASNNVEYNKNVLFSWSDSLLDNMLCMASTPKGVISLNETGLLKQTVNYMLQRYKLRLQVGKNEKFGYGFLISQIATIPSGSYYLNESNLIQHLIDDIWSELEYGISDDFMTAFPRSHPSESIDRYVYKPMLCLINILSSFSSVYEILVDAVATPRMNYTVRQIPEGVIGLLDRVLLIDKDIKIQSLFNYEQTHTFGLRLLSFLQSDLDVLLLLEAQYSSTQLLLENQKENVEDEEIESSEIIIDMLSIERNYALVQANVIGGSKEKQIPSRTIDSKLGTYAYPLFSSLPVPSQYIKNASRNYTTDEKLLEFVQKHEQIDDKWIQKARKMYMTAIKKGYLSINVMSEFLLQILEYLPKVDANVLFTSDDCTIDVAELNNISLSNLQVIGVEKAITYGIQIGQIKREFHEQHCENLTNLIKATKLMLRQPKISKSKLNIVQDCYPGYDWFVSTIFLLFNGHFDNSWSFLCEFQKIYHSAFLWTARLYSHVDVLPLTMVNNGINIALGTVYHYIEHIMKIELPLLFSAFRMSGLPPSQICSHWIKQCFWNYLDWPDLVTYICICIVYGIDYQVYYCLAIIKFLESSIIEHHNFRDLQFFLKENQIKNFKIEDYFDYMTSLEQKYRQYITFDIKEFFARPVVK